MSDKSSKSPSAAAAAADPFSSSSLYLYEFHSFQRTTTFRFDEMSANWGRYVEKPGPKLSFSLSPQVSRPPAGSLCAFSSWFGGPINQKSYSSLRIRVTKYEVTTTNKTERKKVGGGAKICFEYPAHLFQSHLDITFDSATDERIFRSTLFSISPQSSDFHLPPSFRTVIRLFLSLLEATRQ